jgi:exonuclease VII small subunit
MGDLQNGFNTGMINYWQRAQEGETLSNTFCTLPAWPGPFVLTPEQDQEFQRPDVADPELEEAIRLTNEGLTLAVEARAIYEPSCQNLTLAETALQGITLAEAAREKLTEAQQLVETIRRRTQ